jgi:two-component system sensor histidine kinase PhoQ
MRFTPRSLSARLLLASALLLPTALGASGWYLERAHRTALDAASVERLQLQVLALLAQADVAEQFRMPLQPLEPRLTQPKSGLYAMVTGKRGELLWLSPSADLLADPVARLTSEVPPLNAGEAHESELEGLFRHSYQVVWELESGEELPLRFTIAESTAPRDADLKAFRQQLWIWLGASALLLLAVQWLIIRWGLQPLSRLSRSISRIEAGEQSKLEGEWPPEVEPVAENLQLLLDGEQQRRDRLRNTLADLAHSLKTPLAVLRSADPNSDDYGPLREEQIGRMEEVITWQLQRAEGGRSKLLQRTPVLPPLQRLRDTLVKVYADRHVTIEIQGGGDALYKGDERDFLELMGNLLDNACKYGKRRVEVTVNGGTGHAPLQIAIDDDGDGISPELRDTLLLRGVRADSRREGQGLGLALVADLISASGGELAISTSPLGGARVALSLP